MAARSAPSAASAPAPPSSGNGGGGSGSGSGSGSTAPRQFPLFALVRVVGVGRPTIPVREAVVAAAMAETGGSVNGPDDDGGATAAASATRRRTTSFFKTLVDDGAGGGGGAAGGVQAAQAAQAAQVQPTIVAAAAAGCVGHAFLAVYSSNDQLVLRYAGGSGFPTVRVVPWFRDPARRVVALDFNPTAEWLVCACADTALYLVPALALLLGPSATAGDGAGGVDEFDLAKIPSVPNGAPEKPGVARDWLGRLPSLMTYALDQSVSNSLAAAADVAELGSGADITLVWMPQRSFRGTANITCCLWWRTWGGLDLCIVGNSAGGLSVCDLRLKCEVYSVRLKSAVSKIELVEDAVQSYRYLLIQTVTTGFWKLLLEQQNDEYHIFDTLLSFGGKPPFVPVPMQRFPQNAQISLQRNKQGNVLGVFYPSNNKFEVFDPAQFKYALYVYQLSSDLQHLHLTDRFIFATSPGPYNTVKLSVLSNIVAGTSANPLYLYNKLKDSIMQEFRFAAGETVQQVLRAYPISRMMMEKYRSDGSSAPADAINRGPVTADTVQLEGCIVVTNRAVYELRQHVPAEIIFFGLLAQAKDKNQAELLGKTVGLDMFQLYESAGDQQFSEGQYNRALELYLLSNLRTSKLIDMFLRIDRTDVVLAHLQKILSQPESVPVSDRKRYAEIVFKIYVQRLLNLGRGRMSSKAAAARAGVDAVAEQGDPTLAAVEQEFRTFLETNADYDSGVALIELIKHGWEDMFFEVAHIRQIMPVALNILVNRSAVLISRQHLKFLLKHNYIDALKQCSSGVLLRCMAPNDQIDIILTQPSTVLQHASDIRACLPRVDEKRLRKIASFLESWLRQRTQSASAGPSRTPTPSSAPVTPSGTQQPAGGSVSSAAAPDSATADSPTGVAGQLRAEEIVELFLHTLLRSSWNELENRRKAIKLAQAQQKAAAEGPDSGSPTDEHAADGAQTGESARSGTKRTKSLSFAPSVTKSAPAPAQVPASTPGDTDGRRGSTSGPACTAPPQPSVRGIDRLLATRPGSERSRAMAASVTQPSPAAAHATAAAPGASPSSVSPPTAPTAVTAAVQDADDTADSVTRYFYGQLRLLLGQYRPALLLQLSVQLGHWDAVAELYELLLDWPQSLEFRLRSIAHGWAAHGGFVTSSADEVHLALATADQLLGKMRARCHPTAPLLVVQTLLKFWHERKHPTARLRAFFLEQLELLAVPLGAFLATTRPVDSLAVSVPRSASAFAEVLGALDSQFLLAVTQRRLKLLREQHQRELAGRVSVDRLWSQIKTNLEKDLERRTKLTLPASALVWRSDGYHVADAADKDAVVFTCGHQFFRREFFDTVLPELRRRLEALPVPVPLTTQVVLADYHQPHQMHAACPICLFNGVRQDVPKLRPDVPAERIKPWAV